jgi:hypothetical protein
LGATRLSGNALPPPIMPAIAKAAATKVLRILRLGPRERDSIAISA